MTLSTALSHPGYHDDEAARITFEAVRWPGGPYCPHRGCFDTIAPLGGKSIGSGWYWCNKCRAKFTVRVGSVLERSYISMHKWMLAFRSMASSKKCMSAHQLPRTLGIPYKTAWFMAHRIPEAMRPTDDGQLGEGKTVEIDETFVGGLEKNKHRSKRKHVGTGSAGKEAVFSLIERGGVVRSRHVPAVTAAALRPILKAQVHEATFIMTNEGATDKSIGSDFKSRA